MLAAQDDSWQLRVRGGGGHDLLTVSPLLESAACGLAVAPIGLVNMMNAGGAVLSAELEGEWEWEWERLGRCLAAESACWQQAQHDAQREWHQWQSAKADHELPIFPATAAAEDAKNGSCRAVLRLELRGCGRFLLYSSRRPAAVQLNGQPAEALEWQEQRGALRFGVPWQQEGAAAGRGGRHTVLISF